MNLNIKRAEVVRWYYVQKYYFTIDFKQFLFLNILVALFYMLYLCL